MTEHPNLTRPSEVRALLTQLDAWHADEDGTGYYLTASDSADVPLRIRGDVTGGLRHGLLKVPFHPTGRAPQIPRQRREL